MGADDSSGSRRFSGPLWILFLGRLITSTGHSISFPFFAMYFHLKLGVPMSIVGATITAGSLVGAFGKFFGGDLSDRLGRKSVMALALVGRAASTVGLAVMALSPEPSVLAIAALYVASVGFGFLFEPASHAMVADLSDPSVRMHGFNLLRVGGNLGWAIGGIIGGLIGAHSYSAMFFTTAGITFAAALLVALLVPETRWLARSEKPVETVPYREIFRIPGFVLLCASSLLIHIVISQLVAPMSVFGKRHLDLSEQQIGLMFTINGMIIVLFQIPVGSWINRRTLTSVLAFGCLLYALGYGSTGWATGFWTLASCVVVLSLGELLVAPSTITLASNLAPEDARGRTLGAYGVFDMVGRCLGPSLGGLMLDAFPTRPWIHWIVIALIALGAAVGFAWLGRVSRKNVPADGPKCYVS